MQADLILYALVAAGLVFWLRSVLGTRHGEERDRPNPFAQAENPAASDAKPAAKPAVSLDDTGVPALSLPSPVLPRNVSVPNDEVQQKLSRIASHDRNFDIARFAQGAQDAFALIVEAFADGDRETLRPLLEPQVYAAFDGAITGRQQKGETCSTEIHAVRKLEIIDAHEDGQKAYITVRVIADETCVIRAADGSILSGDPDRVTEMNDIWVFSHPLKSRDPAWYLYETRDGDSVEEHKTPVPDSH